jgi:hypothetical protein
MYQYAKKAWRHSSFEEHAGIEAAAAFAGY